MTQAPELILHIGHYKTGTTALQVFCERNRALLAAQGLHYAAAPVKFAKHSALAFSLLREAGVEALMHDFANPDSAETLWQRLFDAVRALPAGQSMLVSSEEFIRFGAHPGAAAALAARVDTARELRFRVIAYLRAPQAHLESWYNQLVKMRVETGGFEAAVREQMEPVHWDYALALKPWIEIFGPEAIVLRPFDSRLREGDALYEDFLHALGFALPVLAEVPPGDPNPRLDPRLLALRRGYNRAPLPRGLAEQLLAGARAGLLAEDGHDAGPDFETIRARALAGIEALARLPGAGIDPARMAEDLPRRPAAPAPVGEEVVTLLAAEIARLRQQLARQAGRIAALEKASGGAQEETGDSGGEAG